MIDTGNPYIGIRTEDDLLKAFVEAQLRLIGHFSTNMSGEAAQLKAWMEQFVQYSDIIREAPEIDWSPYILENHDAKPSTE